MKTSKPLLIVLIIAIPATSVLMGILMIVLAYSVPEHTVDNANALNKVSWKAP